MVDFTLTGDLIGAMDILRKRLQYEPNYPGDEPPVLFLNVAEANKGRRFTNANCPACPAHTEVKITPPGYPGAAR